MTSRRTTRTATVLTAVAGACLVPSGAALAATTPTPAPVEPYASYEPQKTCSPSAKPGTLAVRTWVVRTYGGGAGGIGRSCSGRSVSEHKEGRAFDWTLSATRAADRARASKLLTALFATGPSGQPAELARRMGVMYVIWNDRMYASYDHFAAKAYRSSSCRTLRSCSPTLRHRDHVHVSLSWAGARARTSWYATPAGRAAARASRA